MRIEWQSDWKLFAREVAEHFNTDQSDRSLSAKFGGSTVCWRGLVKDIQTDAEYAAGITLHMPRVEAIVKSGYRFIAEYAFAGTTAESTTSWSDAQVGDEVEFECELSAGNELFAGVKVSTFDEEKECYLEMALVNATLKRVVSGYSINK